MVQKLWEKSVQVNKDIERFTVGRDFLVASSPENIILPSQLLISASKTRLE